MITVPTVFVLCGAHLLWDRHALLQQSVNIIVKLLLEESIVNTSIQWWVGGLNGVLNAFSERQFELL